MTSFTGIENVDAILAAIEPTTNARGNEVRHYFLAGDRYGLDFALPRPPWRGFDTESDAHYLGYWIDKENRRFLAYIEGDVYFTQCADERSYDAELAALCESHLPGTAFTTITDDGVTRFYQDRREFFFDVSLCPGSSIIAESAGG